MIAVISLYNVDEESHAATLRALEIKRSNDTAEGSV
jgi:hypothetical protein